MTNYREKLRGSNLSLDKLANILYGAAREVIDEKNRPMFTLEIGQELEKLFTKYYRTNMSAALGKYAVQYANPHGLYITALQDGIKKFSGGCDRLMTKVNGEPTFNLFTVLGNMKLLYRTEEELRLCIEERVSIETIRVATFKL